MSTYAVTARLPDGREVKLTSFDGTAGRDWSDLLGGPAKSEYVRRLVALGHSEPLAQRAEFKAIAVG